LPGIRQHRKGRIEVAHGGDLFLDEIGELSPTAQARLLRVVERGQFERVGDTVPVSVDVRLIAATSTNMSTLVEQGAFRPELHRALSVLPIYLPPLRERKEDIPLLAEAFIRQLRQKSEKPVSGLHPGALQWFMEYDWPGNVGELKSALAYAFATAASGSIEFDHLPESIQNAQDIITATPESTPLCQASSECDEKNALIQALKATRGNKSAAAKLLGVNRMTVWNRMRKYGLHLEMRIKV
jgi:two-component system, NtrC family, response regulator HydG